MGRLNKLIVCGIQLSISLTLAKHLCETCVKTRAVILPSVAMILADSHLHAYNKQAHSFYKTLICTYLSHEYQKPWLGHRHQTDHCKTCTALAVTCNITTVKHIFCVHQIFANFASRIKSRNSIPAKIQFAHQKSLVNTSRTLGKRQIKMQRNFYVPKSRN